MSIQLPETAIEIDARSKADVQRELATSNPFLKNSWLGAIVTSTSNRVFDFYLQLKEAIKQSFPDTATGSELARWAAIWGKQKNAATKASGNIVATGTATTVIPISTILAGSLGNYTTIAAATISAQSLNVSGIIRSGQTATVTTASDHGLANNVSVTISGADQAEYNITANITVTGLDTFEYQVAGSPATPATGTILAAVTFVDVPVQADNFGDDFNLNAGVSLTLQSPIVGVDNIMVVDFGQVSGGLDQETDASLRTRMLNRIQNPVSQFNTEAITEAAKEITGVTRVFVEAITPAVGQVTVYFMRDGDTNPIPTGAEVAKVRAEIEAILPANTDTLDLFVNAPTAVMVPFTFTALTPNTNTMRSAIDANLRQFFDESTTVGVNIDKDAYRSAIFNTVDTITGDVVLTFTLSTPTTDITIASGEIGTLGTITYAI